MSRLLRVLGLRSVRTSAAPREQLAAGANPARREDAQHAAPDERTQAQLERAGREAVRAERHDALDRRLAHAQAHDAAPAGGRLAGEDREPVCEAARELVGEQAGAAGEVCEERQLAGRLGTPGDVLGGPALHEDPRAGGGHDERRSPEDLVAGRRDRGAVSDPHAPLHGGRLQVAQAGDGFRREPPARRGRLEGALEQREHAARDRGRGAETGEHGPRAAAWRRIAAWWLASRLLVVGLAVLARETGWPRPEWRAGFLLDGGPLGLLGAWDGRWYALVAEHGYVAVPGAQSDAAFFPLLPLALRALGALGLPAVPAGVLLANLGLLAGLVLLYELGRRVLPEPDARRAAILAAVAPAGFVFSMAYPEGLALATLAGAMLAAHARRFAAAAVLAAATALARPEGFLVAIPLAAAALGAWGGLDDRRRVSAVTAMLAGPAALAGLTAYQWRVLGSPLAWSAAERAWGRSFSPLGPLRAVEHLGRNPWPARDAIAFAVALACLAVARRAGVPRSWVLFGLLVVALPVASGTFESDARFGLLALPVYLGLAVLSRRLRVERAVLAASALLLAAGVLSVALRSP